MSVIRVTIKTKRLNESSYQYALHRFKYNTIIQLQTEH